MSGPRRLPPLNRLRAFEAAARHLSLTLAAEELHVTPAAISQQVASLEDYLGVALFVRGKRSLKLTEAGRAGLPLISEGLDRLAEGFARLLAEQQRVVLRLSVAPAFADKWLVPRMERFTAAYPALDVEILAQYGVPEFGSNGIDLAVHYGDGRFPGHYVEPLFAVAAIPVCSPRLLAGEHPLRTPGDLAHHRLIHDETLTRDSDRMTWERWLQAAGIDGVDGSRGSRFSHPSLALEAAIGGQGVALSIDLLATPEIAAGRLVAPFDIRIPLDNGYYLVGASDALDQPRVREFRDWIMTEATA